jgi:ParB/RepB/Spo0J family partition protein
MVKGSKERRPPMIYSVEEIGMGEIEINNKILSRQTDGEKDLDDLISSIKKTGLLQPISVYPIAYKKYVLIAGLRRYLAYKKMGEKKIMAAIHICKGGRR